MITNLVKLIKEGSASVHFPKEVFYNPVQEFNRDLTISVINLFNTFRKSDNAKIKNSENKSCLKIFEALSATGLRSIRFAKEIENVEKIIANDIDPIATNLIKENVSLNNVHNLIDVNCGDANLFMYQSQANNLRFHVVDLDPYGSASRFLDAAVQSLTNGGLLCVTCTDAAVLCGAALGTSMGKYGSVAIGSKMASSHEQGLRIMLHAIQSSASKHGLYIEPLLSLSVDFYFRVFVRIWDGPGVVKSISTKLGMVFFCVGCHTQHIQPLGTVENLPNSNKKIHCAQAPVVGNHCEECGGKFIIGGPLWIGPIHDQEFCNGLINQLKEKTNHPLGTAKRIIGMVSLAAEELPEVPLYYEIDKLAGTIRSITPPILEMRSAILNAGFEVSSSHCAPSSIKTNAPPKILWNIMRCYLRMKEPEKISKLLTDPKASQYLKQILSKDDSITVSFEYHNDANPQSRSLKLLRFQRNPLPNWGPKPKASKFQKE